MSWPPPATQSSFGRVATKARLTRSVAEVDPNTRAVRQLVDYKGNDFFKLGTVAISVNDEIWIGGINGSYGIARLPR